MTRLLTIADAISTHARLTPGKLGARDSHRSLTFADWDARAGRLASGLQGLGLAKGDRVGIVAANCIEWLELYVALARAGLVAVPVNFRLSAPEVAYILHDAEAGAVIAGPEFCATVDAIRSEVPLAKARFIVLGDAPHDGWRSYESVIAQGRADAVFPAVTQEDVCALMYTSGTTGRPKGAIRKHGGSSLIALATALEMGFTREDVGLLVMPLCHANSLYFGTTFMHVGATIVVDDRRSFDPEALVRTLAEEKVTFTSLVPTHYIMVLALPEAVKRKYDVSAVGKLMISSAPARRDTKLGILEFFRNGRLYELYGSTEHGWVTLLRPHEQLDKLGSVGREWAGSGAIRLLDPEGKEVPDGEVGELYSRTSYVFDGYWKLPGKTAEAFRGDWCTVGDMARRDADGYIWLVDRKSNMIISGGENVYPSEVEGVLGAHPAVKDVAVIGVPHEKWGEAVQAVVVLHEGQPATAEELRAWCKQRLAGFKCPAVVSFVADGDMPRTATGKILHRVLRQRVVG
ncbi:class I adenylate-forming enzyme family protein [Ramlibacter montanisoli]|uniref:AMP-binding protein n=1 Tax=Ramlibacter montanisoli TaxID=2732512 RepID=A0A849K7K8_9BURK|nr:AMP-binding protein [Ramlibacter montanisoli]NNU42037.1 AMP-binding protein [Ramlibacter montanisoli]